MSDKPAQLTPSGSIVTIQVGIFPGQDARKVIAYEELSNQIEAGGKELAGLNAQLATELFNAYKSHRQPSVEGIEIEIEEITVGINSLKLSRDIIKKGLWKQS